MKNYFLVLLLITILLVSGCKKMTQSTEQPELIEKIYSLLIVDSQIGEPYESARKAILDSLTEAGYEEGKNLKITYYSIGNDIEEGKNILAKELPNNYDAVVTNGTVMTKAAQAIAYGDEQYNFIFSCVTDPVGVGVIDGFDDFPKANFTGVCYPVPVKSRLKFIKQLMPEMSTIGLIYADMSQSQSYRKWVEELLANDPEFKDIEVIFRPVPLITGDDGSRLMAESARQIVRELDSQVDIFLSPNDQMGVQPYFAQVVYEEATKPLCGLGKNDVLDGWGATMSMYPSHESMGQQAAAMIVKLFEGEDLKRIIPEWPKNNGVAFDAAKIDQFNVNIPFDLIKLAGENIINFDK